MQHWNEISLEGIGEEIKDIEGGTQKKLEDDAYLIQAQDVTVKIQLETVGLHYSK